MGTQEPVGSRGRAAALNVPDNRDAGIELRNGFLHPSRYVGSGTFFLALGYDNDKRGFGAFPARLQGVNHHIHTHLGFGNHHDFGPAPNRARNSNIARVAAHHLHKKATIVRVGRITNFINAIQCRIHGRVVANGIIGAVEVVVDGAGRTHRRNTKFFLENHGSGEGAVATNGHQTLDAVVHQLVESLLPALLSHKFLTAG